ncbi:MAG: phosphoribosylpyrophosphate synthetase [Saprospiraceae bacterium]
MRNYDNLVEALNDLKSKGYSYDFNLLDKGLRCEKLDKDFSPVEFNVEEVIHFEGDDSSADSRSILYVIETSSGIQGTLLTTNSIYHNNLSKELIEKLR